jgi:2-oxo-4-hydroxy-4-carboxy-5-ureidoimidazoline decarboxylase
MSGDTGLARLQEIGRDQLEAELRRCFGSVRWASAVTSRAPFTDREALLEAMESAWEDLPQEEWLAAIQDHPRIGESAGDARFAATRRWSRDEQSGVSDVGLSTRAALAQHQAEYEARFGYVFLICASGKSGEEILTALRARSRNDPETELAIASEELRKIAILRLAKLLQELGSGASSEARK